MSLWGSQLGNYLKMCWFILCHVLTMFDLPDGKMPIRQDGMTKEFLRAEPSW